MKRLTRCALSMLLVLLMLAPGLAPAEALDIHDLSEPVTIVVYSNAQNRAQRALEDDIIRQKVQEALNIDLQLTCMPTADYTSTLNLLVTSGSVPDVFSVDAAQFETFSSQELLLDLTPYLPLMDNYRAAFPGVEENEAIRKDGKMYIVSGRFQRPAEENVLSYMSLWVRQDWLDNLGLTAPATLEEFAAVAKAFTEDDPDGNGLNDTYGFTSFNEYGISGINDPFSFIFGAFGVGSPLAYIERDGKAVLSATTEETREALAYIKNLIDSGAVDPDLMALKDYNQSNEKLYQGQAGLVFRSWATFVKPPFDEQLAELTPEARWVQIPTLRGMDGGDGYMLHTNLSGPVQSGYVLGEHLLEDPVKLARVLKYLDYIALGEGLDLVCYGIEGEHFTRDENGVLTIDADRLAETENGYQHQLCGRIERDYLFGKFPTLHEEITFATSQPYITSYNAFVTIPDGYIAADKDRYVSEEMIKFMYGNRSLNTFDEFVSTLYSTYGQQVYDDLLNENLKEAGIF